MRDKQIEQLFFLQRDITIGVRDGILVFINAAGRERLPALEPGASVQALFPKDVLAMEEETFAASVLLEEQAHTVLGTRMEDIRIYTLIPQEDPGARERLLLEKVCGSMRRTLTVLNMATELLAPTVFQMEEPRQKASLATIHKTYYQLERLCDNLDHFFRLQDGERALRLENTDLVQFCRDLIQSVDHFGKKLGVKLLFHSSSRHLLTAIDRPKINKLLLNLISNSLSRMEKGGQISLDLRMREKDVIFTLKDTGPGIPPENIAHVFGQYQRERAATDIHGGVGLGFPVVRKIAELHGGTLLLTSRKNQGTTVLLYLPLRRAESEGALQEGPPPYCDQSIEGMHTILMELANVLDDEAFQPPYLS